MRRVRNQTFDEWYFAKNGHKFSQDYMQPGERYDDSFRALSRAVRDYVSEMVQDEPELDDGNCSGLMSDTSALFRSPSERAANWIRGADEQKLYVLRKAVPLTWNTERPMADETRDLEDIMDWLYPDEPQPIMRRLIERIEHYEPCGDEL
jgi:hypothetical protein